MNEPFPYIACPDCESQLLNPTIRRWYVPFCMPRMWQWCVGQKLKKVRNKMNDAERLMTYIIINAWNQKKCWTNFKALWSTFDSCVVWCRFIYYHSKQHFQW